MKLLTIAGTRPECVKTAPILTALARRTDIVSCFALTGQHSDLAMAPLELFGIAPDFVLDVDAEGHEPLAYVRQAVPAIQALLRSVSPDRVIVQGDTASAMAAAQAAAALGISVSHVEAGLRTHTALPWPEEPFRVAIDAVADQLFAPTPLAARNLRDEAVAGAIHITGNSGIDALHAVLERLQNEPDLARRCDAMLPRHDGRPRILATLHRRENIGRGAAELCAAVRAIDAAGTAQIVIPLHPNPAIGEPIRAALAGCRQVHLLPALSLEAMVRLMQSSDLIISDSGGIQEEAPSLGKPVLVLRDVTERPEGVAAGLATLTGARRDAILKGVAAKLSAGPSFRVANPYGDGRAAKRIVAALAGEHYEPFDGGLPVGRC